MSRFEYPQEYSEEECGLTHGPPVFEMQTQNMAWVSLVVKNMFNSCPKKIQGDLFFCHFAWMSQEVTKRLGSEGYNPKISPVISSL